MLAAEQLHGGRRKKNRRFSEKSRRCQPSFLRVFFWAFHACERQNERLSHLLRSVALERSVNA